MAEVIPFKGVLYNPEKVDVGSVMAPPYDIVTPEFKEVLYKRSPHNIIRIDFGKDRPGDNERGNRYTRAAKSLTEWLKQGILTQDKEASFYCYETSYTIDGKKNKLKGFLCAVRLEELGSGKIHPHEMTYSKPKTDRLNILRFCKANISPIFALYSSKKKLASSILEKTSKRKAVIKTENGDGFIHRLWRINDRDSVETIKNELSGKDIFIADGHHRYETALEFRNEMNKIRGQGSGVKGQDAVRSTQYAVLKPWDYVMMFLVNMEDDGLTILPTHRLVRTAGINKINDLLKQYFDIKTIRFHDLKGRQDIFRLMQKHKNSFGMYIKNENVFHVLRFKGRYSDINSHESLNRLDVTILHKLIFERLLKIKTFQYEMDPELVISKLNNDSFQAAFFLNPTKVHDVKKVALAGRRMPPKSTYFYPKLLTGMVIYKF